MKKNRLQNYPNSTILPAPSLLAANFAELGSEIKSIEKYGAKILHLDIMDGHFVPNLTIGPPVIKKIRTLSDLIFDVHLMLSRPLDYVDAFANAGADNITFHIEAENEPQELIDRIRKNGCSVGITLKPGRSFEDIAEWIPKCDIVLVMTVEPGFGGQNFMKDMMIKVEKLKNFIKERGLNTHIEVDGGINGKTAKFAKDAGANILVAGTSVFRHPEGVKVGLQELLNA